MKKIKEQMKIWLLMAVFAVCMMGTAVTVQAASADNSLSSLTLSEGTLSPSFVYNVVNYTAQVGADTTSVDVKAVTSASTAVVKSITGNTDLKQGENVIQIVVQAENGNLATYKITVTRGGAVGTAPADTQTQEPAAENGTSEPAEGAEAESTPAETTGAEGYTVASAIPEEIIPSDFTQTTINYQGAEQAALTYFNNAVTLLYMTNDAGNGALFVYEAESGAVYPFIKLTTGGNSLILLKQAFDLSLGNSFVEAALMIGDKKAPCAYQDTLASTTDYYVVYGMNNAGNAGWYQYDSVEGTYQRFQPSVQAAVEAENTEASDEYAFLQNAYNDLSDKYTALKKKDTRTIIGLIIAAALLAIVLVNVLIFGRRRTKDTDDFLDEEPVKKTKKAKREKPKKKKKKEEIFDDYEDKDDYYDEETEYRSDPDTMSHLDDDLEVLDLNDL